MVLRMYIFLRTDLKYFGKGSLVAQACHAVSSTIQNYNSSDNVRDYLNDLPNMHKVVFKITKDDIKSIETSLDRFNINYSSWVEQPENVITCICTVPIDISNNLELRAFMNEFKLY